MQLLDIPKKLKRAEEEIKELKDLTSFINSTLIPHVKYFSIQRQESILEYFPNGSNTIDLDKFKRYGPQIFRIKYVSEENIKLPLYHFCVVANLTYNAYVFEMLRYVEENTRGNYDTNEVQVDMPPKRIPQEDSTFLIEDTLNIFPHFLVENLQSTSVLQVDLMSGGFKIDDDGESAGRKESWSPKPSIVPVPSGI